MEYKDLLKEKKNTLEFEADTLSEEEKETLKKDIKILSDYIKERGDAPEWKKIRKKVGDLSSEEIAKMDFSEHKKLWELQNAIAEKEAEEEEAELERAKQEALKEILDKRKSVDEIVKKELSPEEQEEFHKKLVAKNRDKGK